MVQIHVLPLGDPIIKRGPLNSEGQQFHQYQQSKQPPPSSDGH
jgi:hypothetical protein